MVSAFQPGVKRHHPQDDRADENIVGKPGYADQDNAITHRAEDQHADDGPDDRSTPAGERRTADHDHRNDLQFVTGAAVRISRRNSDRTGDTGVRGDDRRQDEQHNLCVRYPHTARACRVRVAARSLNPVTGFRFGQHVAQDYRKQDEPEERRKDTQSRQRKIPQQ